MVLDYPRGSSVVTRDLVRGRQEGNVMTETEVAVMCFEDGGRGREPRNEGASRRWRRPGNRFSPRDSRGNAGRQHLDFSPPTTQFEFLTSRIVKIINVCCFKLPVICYSSSRKLI